MSSLIVVFDFESTGRKFSILYSLYDPDVSLAKNISVWHPPDCHKRKYCSLLSLLELFSYFFAVIKWTGS